MSNHHQKGAAFARRVREYLQSEGLDLQPEHRVAIGVNQTQKKFHKFDWGSNSLLVECKAYDWTKAGHVPSAKLTTVNEAMLHFLGAPKTYRKMLFMLATEKRPKRISETLADYYVRMNGHLIPDDVEVYEFDADKGLARHLWPITHTPASPSSETHDRSDPQAEESNMSSCLVFNLTLHKTYYNQGFFNITVEFDHCIGGEGPVILELPDGSQIEGKVNRTMNPNGTARIMQRAALRDWFKCNYTQGDTVPVRFATPHHLLLG